MRTPKPVWIGNIRNGALISNRAWAVGVKNIFARTDDITVIKRKFQDAIDSGRLAFHHQHIYIDGCRVKNSGRSTWNEITTLADRLPLHCPTCGQPVKP